MTTIAKGSALALGALLYFAEEFLLGYLAATPVPRGYFAFLGSHKVIALVLEEAVLVALPAFVLALGWGLVATTLIRRSPYRVAGWTLAGLVIAWGARLLQSVIEWPGDLPPGSPSSAALLLSLLVPPIGTCSPACPLPWAC